MKPPPGLLASRSTGPVTVTVTPSIGAPAGSVMKNSALVVGPPGVAAARGLGACVVAAGTGGAGVGDACNRVNSRRATMMLMVLRTSAINPSGRYRGRSRKVLLISND